MIALLAALSLSPAPSAAPTPAPVAITAPAIVQPPASAIPGPEAQVLQLQALFDQSCAQRAYATYDDLCEALKAQVKSAQRAADRAKRRAGPRRHPALRRPIPDPQSL